MSGATPNGRSPTRCGDADEVIVTTNALTLEDRLASYERLALASGLPAAHPLTS